MTDEPDNSQAFREMATRIDLNKREGFSGAAVLVPPGDGKRMEMLLLRNEGDPAMFWHLVKTHAEIAIQEAAAAEQQQAQWGRR